MTEFGNNASQPKAKTRLGLLLIPILTVHVLVIFGPLAYYRILDHFKPPEENLFRVKIGGRELSHAEHVGKPERKAPGTPAPPPPAEPEAAPAPAAEPDDSAAAAALAARRAAVIERQKRAAEAKKKKAAELRKRKLAEKRRAEQLKKKKLAEQEAKRKAAELKKKRLLEQEAKRKAAERRRQAAAEAERRRQANDVYHPADRNVQIGRRGNGGTNPNSKVPIGARDVGQKYGKQDNADPGGGLNEKVEVYGKLRLVPYLKTKWDEPPDSLLAGRRPEVLIELTIEANGRITATRIIKKSGIKAMDDSVEILLKKLDRVPAPPERVTLQVKLETNDLLGK